MAPKDVYTEENFENQLKELKTRQIYLGNMIKSLDKKNSRAKEWILENRKEIITSYKQLLSQLANGEKSELLKTLKAEQQKIKKARPAPKANEVFIRMPSKGEEENSVETITYSFEGTKPETEQLATFIKQQNLGLSARNAEKMSQGIIQAIKAERAKMFDEEKLDKDVGDLFEELDANHVRLVVKLHDRKPLPKPTSDMHSIWGVILDITDKDGTRAATAVLEAFAGDKRIENALSDFPLGVPQSLFNEIDDTTRQNIEDETSVAFDEGLKTGWWGRIRGKEDRMFEQAIAETKTELLKIEGNPVFAKARNMDFWAWTQALVEDRGAEEYPKPSSFESLLDQHKKAESVIRLAQNDFNETLRTFSEAIIEDTHAYIEFTTALNDLSKAENVEILKQATQKHTFKDFRAWALEAKGYNSLTELALDQLGHGQKLLNVLDVLESKTDETPLTSLHLEGNLEEAANNLVTTYFDMASEVYNPVGQKIEDNADTLSRIIEKSGTSYIQAVLETKTFEKAYKMAGTKEPKIKIIAALLNAHFPGRDPDTEELAKCALSLLDLSKDANSRLINLSQFSEVLFEQSYALAKIMNPEADILDPYLKNPTETYSAKIFLMLWENGVTHNTLDKTEIAKQMIANLVDHDQWTDVLPAFWQLDDADFVSDMRKHLLSGQPETVFDTVYQTGDAQKIAAVMSILTSPAERANFYEKAAKATSNKELEKEYLENVKSIDGDFIEYKDGCILNPAQITNIYCPSGPDGEIESSFIIANGREYELPGYESPEQVSDLFQALNRSNLVFVETEFLNPEKLDYIEVREQNGDIYLQFSYKNFSAPLQIQDDADISAILKSLSDKNPDLMEINGSSLVNMATLHQVFFDDNNNVYFINNETCFKDFHLTDAEYKALTKLLNENPDFEPIGSQYINMKQLDAIEYVAETGEVYLRCGKTVYDGKNRIRPFNEDLSNFILPPIIIDEKQAEKAVDILDKQGFVLASDRNIWVNPANLATLTTQELQGTLDKKYTLQFLGSGLQDNKKKNSIITMYSVDTEFENRLKSDANLTTIGEISIATDKITNLSDMGDSVFISLGSAKIRFELSGSRDRLALMQMKNKTAGLLSTDDELVKASDIETAQIKSANVMDVTFEDSVNCQVKALNSESTLKKLVKGKHSESKIVQKTRKLDRYTSAQFKDWSDLDAKQRQLSIPADTLLFGDYKKPFTDILQDFEAAANEVKENTNDNSPQQKAASPKRKGWPPQN